MPFTFECGVCHAVYRLDEHQITATGVKITCPKCLNYFFLKRGGTESTDTPVVEYVIPDGAYDVSSKVLQTEKEKPRPRTEKTEVSTILESELTDLPPDPPKASAKDQYIMLGLGIIIVMASLIYLNFTGFITIPGFTKFRRTPNKISTPNVAVTPSSLTPTPKFGFPQVDAGYDPWTGKPHPTDAAPNPENKGQ